MVSASDGAHERACVIAIDDVTGSSAGPLKGLARYIAEHPEHRFLIGTHDENPQPIEGALLARDIDASRLFVGPLGRCEVRELVTKMAGADARIVRDKVLRLIAAQHLPRNPFLIQALVAVLTARADIVSLNASGIVDSYVRLLLGVNEAVDFEGLGMDERRREHLLGWMAATLIRRGVVSLPRTDAEELLAGYFRERGRERVSPGAVLESLISRRILRDNRGLVGFRYPMLLEFFAAKGTFDDRDFATELFADPLSNAAILEHVAGLDRNHRELLDVVSRRAKAVMDVVASDVAVEMFDLVEARPGWSENKPTVEHLKRVLAEPHAEHDEDLRQEELDALDEEMQFQPIEHDDGANERDDGVNEQELDAIEPAIYLLAGVIRSSELVDDLEFKADLVKQALRGWSLVTIVFAIREDETHERRRLAEALLGDGADRKEDELDRFVELFLTMIMALIVSGRLGSPHLEGVMTRVLADEEFMADTAPALFATLLCAVLRFEGWIPALKDLHKRHNNHPIVDQLVRIVAVTSYKREGRLAAGEIRRLEDLIADLYTHHYSVGDRARAKGQLLTELRKDRAARQAQLEAGDD